VSFAAGNDTITGNVGISIVDLFGITVASPSTFILTGTEYGGATSNAGMAQAGLTNALTVLGGLASVGTSQNNLNGVSLNPGVYDISAADLTGTLTLTNTLDVTDPSWVFIGSALTSSGSVVTAPGLFDEADAGVFWVITGGSSGSATLSGTFLGNVLASTSITTTGVTDSCGRLLASTGDVTFAGNNTISDTCSASASGLSGGTVTSPVPEPGTFTLLATGLLGVAGVFRRRLSA